MNRIPRTSIVIVVSTAIAASYGVARRHLLSTGGSGRRLLYYVDPMHPAYKSDQPGVAPDCGMPLVAVYADDGVSATRPAPPPQLPSGAVNIDGGMRRLLGIRAVAVEISGATRISSVVGRVAPEDSRVYRINSGVDGVIRETYDDSVGMLVRRDQKLATYYAPDFLAACSGFLAASERVPGAVGPDGARTMPFPGAVSKQGVGSIQGYTDRLRNLGMSDLQIRRIAESRQLPQSIDIVAPTDGLIVARNISPSQHFERSMEFYRIADLSRVWVLAEMSEQDALLLHPGGHAQILLGDRQRYPAKVTESLPQSEAGGGTVKVRLEVENRALFLRPEMLVDVEFPVRFPPAITAPAEALVESGAHSRVYVERGEGVFEPREVETGWRSGELVEIRKGVRPGERVAVGATFLVDSESRLETAGAVLAQPPPAGMSGQMTATGMVKDPNCGMQVDPQKAAASGSTFLDHGATYYFCSRKCKEEFEMQRASASRGGDNDD